jgi:hypothetical protein
MNKTIWALAFVVLCSGFVFAIENASIDGTSYQSGYEGSGDAGSIVIEGGNVTGTNLSATQSTERWAGFYGNISGYLVLAETGHVDYMYRWTYDTGTGGEVCVSTNDGPVWADIVETTAEYVDDVWNFGAVADNATETVDTTESFVIAGQTVTDTDAIIIQSDSSFVSGLLAFAETPATEDEFAFCVNIATGTNYNNTAADYEIMAPTPPLDTETYYFYLELI